MCVCDRVAGVALVADDGDTALGPLGAGLLGLALGDQQHRRARRARCRARRSARRPRCRPRRRRRSPPRPAAAAAGRDAERGHSPPPLCPIAIIRSTAPRARARRSPDRRRTSSRISRSDGSSFSGVIIFMYLQDARSLTAGSRHPVRPCAAGGSCRSRWRPAPGLRLARPLAASTISPVDRILTRSAGTAPAVARYSALVAQPHSGWMYRSASGLACGLRRELAAVDAGVHVALAAPDRDVVPAEHPADVRAEELVGAEQHRACRRGWTGPPRRRSTTCSRCRSPP